MDKVELIDYIVYKDGSKRWGSDPLDYDTVDRVLEALMNALAGRPVIILKYLLDGADKRGQEKAKKIIKGG